MKKTASALWIAALVIHSGAAMADILVYDHNSFNQYAQQAAAALSPNVTVAASGDFNTLLTSQSWELVMVDCPGMIPSGGWADLIDYIGSGNPAVMSFWDWDNDSGQGDLGLFSAFGFNSAVSISLVNGVETLMESDTPVGAAVFANVPGMPNSSWLNHWIDDGDAYTFTGGEAIAELAGNPDPVTILNAGGNAIATFVVDEWSGPGAVEFWQGMAALLTGGSLEADLSITKDDGQSSVVPGDQVVYDITVTNAGPEPALAARVVDVLPPQLTDVTWTCTASGGASCGGTGFTEVEPNDTIATAQDLDGGLWTLTFDPDVGDASTNTSTTLPHLTVLGTGNNTFDNYAFSVATAGDRGIFDIDFGTTGGIDSYLRLYDDNGTLLASNDDSSTSAGQGGSVSVLDSYLEFTFPAPGTYVIEVGSCCVSPVSSGGSYELQVSLENHPFGVQGTGNIDDVVDLPVLGLLTYRVSARVRNDAVGQLTNTATVEPPVFVIDPDPSDNDATDIDRIDPAFAAGRLVYLGLDVSDAMHALRPEARLLAGNAARWAGRGEDPKIAFVEGSGGFLSSVGVRLAQAGLTDLTEVPASELASTDLSSFDLLYLGPTTDASDYVAAASNIAAFGGIGGGLVVEPNVIDPASWTWVPLTELIGHSGATNVDTDTVSIAEAGHPIMNGLTDAGLSNWSSSVHSTFSTPESGGFQVLANDKLQFGSAVVIAREAPSLFRDGFESGDTSAWSGVAP